jgi:hypothetical protein
MCNTCVAESGILSLIPVIEREDLRGIIDDAEWVEGDDYKEICYDPRELAD